MGLVGAKGFSKTDPLSAKKGLDLLFDNPRTRNFHTEFWGNFAGHDAMSSDGPNMNYSGQRARLFWSVTPMVRQIEDIDTYDVLFQRDKRSTLFH